MKTFRSIILTLALTGIFAGKILSAADEIPDRPERLAFPTLNYEPPTPENFRVALKSGPVAYVVPDRTLPLVNITVHVRTGKYLEPVGKEGLAELTGWLLAHGGAGTNTAEQLEERLAFLAADLNSEIGDTEGTVTLNLLSKDLDEGLNILRDVLYAPRFQDDKIKLRKEQMLQEMAQRNDNSENIEEREKDFLAFGEKFWMNQLSTAKSLTAITRKDIETFQHQWFAPENFVLAVSGDFDRQEMTAKLEKTFIRQNLYWAKPPPPIPTNTTFAAPGVYLVDKPDVNQGRVAMMLPGIMRDDPDYFPVMEMNYILGSGGLNSRIMNRVRTDEGLAYSAGSRFSGGIYFPPPFAAGFQSKSRTVAYAASLIAEEIKRIAAEAVSDDDLQTTKSTFIATLPHNFDTKAEVAEHFADDEFSGRYAKDPQFWKKYKERVNAVSIADVQRVAKKYLTPGKLVILAVGNKADILLGHPDHPVKVSDLGNGKVIDLPLRDPLTLKTVTNKESRKP